jgi:hypothetical protein
MVSLTIGAFFPKRAKAACKVADRHIGGRLLSDMMMAAESRLTTHPSQNGVL